MDGAVILVYYITSPPPNRPSRTLGTQTRRQRGGGLVCRGVGGSFTFGGEYSKLEHLSFEALDVVRTLSNKITTEDNIIYRRFVFVANRACDELHLLLWFGFHLRLGVREMV